MMDALRKKNQPTAIVTRETRRVIIIKNQLFVIVAREVRRVIMIKLYTLTVMVFREIRRGKRLKLFAARESRRPILHHHRLGTQMIKMMHHKMIAILQKKLNLKT